MIKDPETFLTTNVLIKRYGEDAAFMIRFQAVTPSMSLASSNSSACMMARVATSSPSRPPDEPQN